MAVQTQIQVRRGTASSWSSTNPTLAAGEIGFESDTGKIKVGTGSATWNSLTYIGAANAIQYVYTATAGQTTFSGADSNGATLAYTVGAEQVYVNGVLQVRGTDYTATNGTSVVLTTATIASDIVTIIAYGTFTVADTYTQAQANAAFTLNTNNNAAGKNAVINGGMDIWQRGTSLGASGSQFIADRWNFFRDAYAAGITVSQQATNDTTNLPNIQYCQRVQRDSGNTSTAGLQTTQNIETVNSIPYAGKTVTLSFYARKGANFSNASSVMASSLYSGTGTDQSLRNGFTNSTLVISQNTTLTTTWQRFSYTGTVASNATQLGISFYYSPNGTAGAADYFEVTGVQLELGSVATAFGRAQGTIQGELAACQRYYYRSTAGTNYAIFGIGNALSTTGAMMQMKFPVTMRTRPTAIEYGGALQLFDGVTALAVTAQTINTDLVTSTDLANFRSTVASGLTQYRPYQLSAGADATAYIGFSAEL